MNKPSCECGTCKTCVNRAHTRRWREEHPERWKEISALSYQRHAAKRRAERARYREENREKVLESDREYTKQRRRRSKTPPEKTRAQMAVHRAIAAGELFPQSCENCGASAYPTHDGRRGVHAHHDDYSKPLEVRWLCYACHGKEHRRYERDQASHGS